MESTPIPASLGRYQVDSVRFSLINRDNLVPSLEAFFGSRPSNNYVCVSNVHTTMECRGDEKLRQIQNDSFLTIADGQPIIFYGKLSGIKDIDRIMGPDIMTEVFNSPLSRERRHFFLGGAPQTLEKMKVNLADRFPHLKVAGFLSPPFRALSQKEEETMHGEILATDPDYIWVCFGAPKQEYWMKRNHGRFPRSLLIGIGAGFAYHAGELKRAPVWAQKVACEWVWRLAQDPRRLAGRYLKTNPGFARLLGLRAISQLLGLRKA